MFCRFRPTMAAIKRFPREIHESDWSKFFILKNFRNVVGSFSRWPIQLWTGLCSCVPHSRKMQSSKASFCMHSINAFRQMNVQKYQVLHPVKICCETFEHKVNLMPFSQWICVTKQFGLSCIQCLEYDNQLLHAFDDCT